MNCPGYVKAFSVSLLLVAALWVGTPGVLLEGALAQCREGLWPVQEVWAAPEHPRGSFSLERPALDRRPASAPLSLNNALVRALVATFAPLYAGTALAEITDPDLNSFAGVFSLGLATAGTVVGPSMGHFCLGDPVSLRRGVIGLGVRTAGGALTAYGLHVATRQDGENFSDIVTDPVRILPGILVVGVGIAYSIELTPWAACGSAASRKALRVTPIYAVGRQAGGLRLNVSI